jgi:hypothetical protein
MTGHHDALFRREHMVEAILSRCDPGRYPLTDGARQYRGMTLVDIARECLAAVGVAVRGKTSYEIAGEALGYHADGTRLGMTTTSDLPNILANVANKTLRQAYDVAPRTFQPWTRQATAPDFKPRSVLQLGEAPSLKLVTEHGEITLGSFGEGKEAYALATYAAGWR